MKYTEFNGREFEIHRMAVDAIESNSSILELGCATGYMTKELLKKHCTVVGLDNDEQALRQAKKINKHSYVGDLNNPAYIKIQELFDYVLCLDVIEHLTNRKEMLTFARERLNSKGVLILSTPNIAHIKVRVRLLQGIFDYEKVGIMDDTHVHFYTKKTIVEELAQAGFEEITILPSVDLGQVPFLGRLLRKLPKKMQLRIVSLNPELFAVQFLLIAKK